eukprot:SAG11_NODE_8118_length_1058_cov_2.248175_1_plen_167_part_00
MKQLEAQLEAAATSAAATMGRQVQRLAALNAHFVSSASGGQMAPRSDWDSSFAPAPLRQRTAQCLAAVATRDVTPPPGVYNRNWGAAPRDTSTGSHLSLRASAFAIAPLHEAELAMLLVTVDLGWLLATETAELRKAVQAPTTASIIISLRLHHHSVHNHIIAQNR